MRNRWVSAFLLGALVFTSIGAGPSTTRSFGDANSVPAPQFEARSLNASIAEERSELAAAGARSLDELATSDCSAPPPEEGNSTGKPAAEALADLSFEPAPIAACCRICSTGKACGNSCISRSYNCYRGVGCACDAAPFVPPVIPPRVVPPAAVVPTVSLSVAQQSAFPRMRLGDTATLTLLADISSSSTLVRDGDVEVRVTNVSEAGLGLRGWDDNGLIARNSGGYTTAARQGFTLYIEALAAGTHRLRVAFVHKLLGPVGPDGVYWDVTVDPVPGVGRLVQGWHSRWAGQSPYLVMRPGQIAEFWIRFSNVGTEPWDRGHWGRQVNLALNGDDKAPYKLGMAVNWLWDDRIATTTSSRTGPGETAEFRFQIRAPLAPGAYRLNLRPVVDGRTWLEDEGVFWVVDVRR